MSWKDQKSQTCTFPKNIPIVMVPLREIETWFLSVSETNYNRFISEYWTSLYFQLIGKTQSFNIWI